MAQLHHHQDCCNSGHCIEAVAEVTTHDHCCGNSQEKEVTTHDHCCGNSQEKEVTTHDDCCGNSQGKNEFNLWRELRAVAIATPLLLIGLIFQDSLDQTPFGIAEYAVLIPAYLLCGWGVLTTAGRNILRGRIFDENFLMTIATIGAIAIHELPEAVGVMLFYQLGELVQGSAVGRSRRSIRALLEVRPDTANLLVNGEIKTVSPDQVAVGEMIRVRPGEKVPLDGEIIEGSSQLDTSALTGESVPRTVLTGDLVLAGMINQSGGLTIRVTKPFDESSIARILDLVENARSKKADTEKFITRFARYYTPVVVFLSLAVALLPPLLISGASASTWTYRALVLLVISCPCGLVISIPLGYFGGIGGAAKRGILIKGSTFLDALTQVKTVVFDKTGTLTKGNFRVTDIITHNGLSQEQLLELAAHVESGSNHPVAQSIRQAHGKPIDSSKVENYQEIAGHGILAQIDGKVVIAGNDRLLHREGISHHVCVADSTVAHLAVDGEYSGRILIADEVKEDAINAIQALHQQQIKTVMLTGDSQTIANTIARRLGIDDFEAELLPEDKVNALEKILTAVNQTNHKTAFVGDGINDAPVIARADVGIAMGGLGSDAAIETADVVIMTDAPSKVADAIAIARRTLRIVWQNIIIALGVKVVFIALGAMGVATLWEAVFADMGVALLAILNASRVLQIREQGAGSRE
ncbi:heavy metal translocating P-type ATPase [Moorena sp. SIO4A5]|uniref:heavy metal translocating P-type ATPase n=1 Tax=Moorena sp. SIO4A5 TaxID=2607838 RepID=UPI0013CA5BB7|nr:heavy metal translocating P-type ATPase [Moorena sp. SIO4A5]NEO22670.1 cadmium-translocating P-type ATPase [Moorena sp. SIO4A5]